MKSHIMDDLRKNDITKKVTERLINYKLGKSKCWLKKAIIHCKMNIEKPNSCIEDVGNQV